MRKEVTFVGALGAVKVFAFAVGASSEMSRNVESAITLKLKILQDFISVVMAALKPRYLKILKTTHDNQVSN
jgi:hypothetical protein